MQQQSDSDSEHAGSTVDGLREPVDEHRDPAYDIDPLFVNRWSPRSMTGDTLPEDDLLALFEAARWAPSSYNNQHWRFVYATPDDDAWDDFVDLLAEGNREWATDAAALVVILSKTTFDHNDEPAPTHSFDTGAATENLALEGARRGLVVHGMQGFDYDAAAELFDLTDEYAVEAMTAIGERDEDAIAPGDDDGEHPNQRKNLDEIVFAGEFTPS
ncbi:nitroreductase family protein [Halococcus saccharolyticus]|uniref:Nitroreductase n=1 Tax=Halococcus saccharolyticus DSM 5350 TaxID=1227455 RepID=M0MHD3_9EURY|nr:nitroreductase family protein [Halococcus saccharolyticus]EMA44758.1 nitroreductase [Halococcus saccharolyticus DSM 5350]